MATSVGSLQANIKLTSSFKDCDELPWPSGVPVEPSAFSAYNCRHYSMSLLSGLVMSPMIDLGAGKTKSSLVKPLPPTLRGPSSTPNSVSRAVISTEYPSLQYNKHCPFGMYITPSLDNIFVWDAVLFMHKGVVSIHHPNTHAHSWISSAQDIIFCGQCINFISYTSVCNVFFWLPDIPITLGLERS